MDVNYHDLCCMCTNLDFVHKSEIDHAPCNQCGASVLDLCVLKLVFIGIPRSLLFFYSGKIIDTH